MKIMHSQRIEELQNRLNGSLSMRERALLKIAIDVHNHLAGCDKAHSFHALRNGIEKCRSKFSIFETDIDWNVR